MGLSDGQEAGGGGGVKFLFWLGNHNALGQRSLEDVIGIVGHQLRALGHEATWDPRNHAFLLPSMGINVVVEGFTPTSIQIIAEAKKRGARFLCLATEEPTDKGFNYGTQAEMVMRQETFAEAGHMFEGILHLVPGEHVTRWYGQFAPSAPAELGYAPTLERVTPQQPEWEFGFFGSVTKRRLKILKQLARRCGLPKAVRIVSDFSTQQERDQVMRSAKVIVQLRKFEAMGLVSSSRCCTALCLGRPIIAEPHLLSDEWEGVVRFAKTSEAFLDEAMFVRAAWKPVWNKQFEQFKRVMSPERCIGEPLRRIGLLEERAAA